MINFVKFGLHFQSVSMAKIEKVKTYKEIKSITNKGEKLIFKSAIIYKISAKTNFRIGILTSRKFGNAVKRNFAKRLIIASLNAIKKDFEGDIVFIPRNQILTMNFEEIKEEFKKI